jgi:hypothetical protein
MLTSAAVVGRPLRTRSAVSNCSRMHAKGIDGRSTQARRFKDLVASFASSLGGDTSLSEVDRALIRNAAALTVQCERLQAAAIAGHEVKSEEMTRLANSSARILTALRLKRQRRDQAPSIAEIAARHRSEGA